MKSESFVSLVVALALAFASGVFFGYHLFKYDERRISVLETHFDNTIKDLEKKIDMKGGHTKGTEQLRAIGSSSKEGGE